MTLIDEYFTEDPPVYELISWDMCGRSNKSKKAFKSKKSKIWQANRKS